MSTVTPTMGVPMANSMQEGLLQQSAAGNTMEDVLAGEGIVVRQKTSECCRCCCWQPPIHWRLTPFDPNWSVDKQYPNLASISEVGSTRCGRCCSFFAPGHRATKYEVRAGEYDEENPNAAAPVLFTHEKPKTCGSNVFIMFLQNGQLRCPCCCNLPYLETKDAKGVTLGKTQFLCDQCLCVPKFAVKDANGTERYRLRPEVCCCGICVKCKCTCDTSSGRCCRVPFLLRDPKTLEPMGGDITDLWAGFKSECCTQKNTYSIKYPPNCDNSMRATLTGSALLVDLVVYEQEQD